MEPIKKQPGLYRGYIIRVGSSHPAGVVQIWSGDELVDRATSIPAAEKIIDGWVLGVDGR